MAVVFQRLLGEPKALDPQQYTKHGGRVSLRCPTCGSIDVISVPISGDGRTLGAYRCITVTCSFRSFIELHAWEMP